MLADTDTETNPIQDILDDDYDLDIPADYTFNFKISATSAQGLPQF